MIIEQTNRNDFNNTWLFEMPMGLGSFDVYNSFVYSIKDLLDTGIEPVIVSGNLYKIELSSTLYYWYSIKDEIILGSEIHKKPQGLVISITAKNPKYKNKSPYASDLYISILKDNPNNIRILSDTQLSDEGYSIWKNLLSRGAKISIYDKENPGVSFKTITDLDEMEKFFKNNDNHFKRFQYVLSENINQLAECKSFFNTRRMRELAGLDLSE